MYTIQILDANGRVRQSQSGESAVMFLYETAYEEGDSIAFLTDTEHCALQADQTIPETFVYLPERKLTYRIPAGELAKVYAPQAFAGDRHLITLRPLSTYELQNRRNLAQNPLDQRFYEGCFPHALANVETRDEAQFFARNAIDGLKCSRRHGHWPYQSWGIGGRADAAIEIHFGRTVRIDEIGITLRADFPHDSWWTKGTLTLSDGSNMALQFQKTGETQYFQTGDKLVTWVRLSELKKARDLSPYPALIEFEVFGRENL